MSKHTPGPWFIADEDKSFVYALAPSGVNSFWAHVESAGPARIDAAQKAANARLIAAAPELLEALQSIAECCNEDHCSRDYASRQTEIRGIARYAIAKATGGK